MASSIFSKPLYVGMATDLSDRYKSHLTGSGDGNTFHSRFGEYSKRHKLDLEVEQLLFVCVPVSMSSGPLSREQIAVLEEILKVICQPVFDWK